MSLDPNWSIHFIQTQVKCNTNQVAFMLFWTTLPSNWISFLSFTVEQLYFELLSHKVALVLCFMFTRKYCYLVLFKNLILLSLFFVYFKYINSIGVLNIATFTNKFDLRSSSDDNLRMLSLLYNCKSNGHPRWKVHNIFQLYLHFFNEIYKINKLDKVTENKKKKMKLFAQVL